MSLLDLPITLNEAQDHEYRYWTDKKPLPSFENHSFGRPGPIDLNFGDDTLYSSETGASFDPLVWDCLSCVPSEDAELSAKWESDWDTVCKFLNKYNYTSEGERFLQIFTRDYLTWALGKSGRCFILKYGNHIAAMACVSYPTVTMGKEDVVFTQVKYLCVHPRYRSSYGKNKNKNKSENESENKVEPETESDKEAGVKGKRSRMKTKKHKKKTVNTEHKKTDVETSVTEKEEKDEKTEGQSKLLLVHAVLDEIIRQHYTNSYRYGLFSTEVFVPTPFVSYREYYRPLNYEKLLEHRFFVLNGDKSSIHERFLEKVKPHKAYEVANEEDLETVYELYNEHRGSFNVSVKYTFEEFKEAIWNPNVKLFVLRSNRDNRIVDFVSYYKYQLSIKGSEETLNCARMFLFSCLREDISVLGANTIRLVAKHDEECDMFWSDDLNQSKDYILSTSSRPDEESDEEDYKKAYEQKFVKYSSVKYLNTFNYKPGMMYSYQVIFPDP